MQVHEMCVFVINQLNSLSCHLYYGTYKTLFDFFCYFYKHFNIANIDQCVCLYRGDSILCLLPVT